jgi:hypothetical protein
LPPEGETEPAPEGLTLTLSWYVGSLATIEVRED